MDNNARSSVLLRLLSLLSLFCIGLGIISIIASNWQQISDTVKLTADILLLAAVAAGIIRGSVRKSSWMTPLIVFYALLIMASIGLVAQVFQLSSHSAAAVILLWCLLTLPLLFIWEQTVLPFFWLPLFSFAIYDLYFIRLLQFGQVFQTLMLNICYFFIWVLLYRTATQFLENRHGFIRAFRFWIVFSFAVSFIGLGALGDFSSFFQWFYNAENNRLFGLCLLVLWSGVYLLNRLQRQSFLLPAMLALSGAYAASMTIFDFYNSYFNFAFTIAALALLAAYAYTAGRTRLLAVSIILAAVRIFVLFLELFGSLMNTGIILICGGILLIATVKVGKFLMEKRHA